MHPKDADGMANSVDPDQTASSEAVCSWSALFAETYLSQYIKFVRYAILCSICYCICSCQEFKVHIIPYIPLANCIFINRISHGAILLAASNLHHSQSNYL